MRNFSKYSDELILDSVQMVVRGERSITQTARILGASYTYVRRWVAMYKRQGLDGLFHRDGNYPVDFKLRVLEDRRENHLSLMETITKYAIPSESTLLKWERLYARDGIQGLYPQKEGKKPAVMKTPKTKQSQSGIDAALIRELEYLRAENAYLKKLRALVRERIARQKASVPKPSGS